jgi:hypothetical protein
MYKYTKQRLQKTFAKSCYEAFLVASDFLGLYYFKYQRSTYELISLPGHLLFPSISNSDHLSSIFCVSDLLDLIFFCLSTVAHICYAHLATAQVGWFIKFDEMLETSSSHSGHTLAGSVSVQELSCLHEKVSDLMFFF